MAKLTLSVDESVVSRAKDYARLRGVSVSRMVEDYLSTVAATPKNQGKGEPPVLRSLRGMLKKADQNDHRAHLESKYR